MGRRQIINFIKSAAEIAETAILGLLVLAGLGATIAAFIGLIIEGEIGALLSWLLWPLWIILFIAVAGAVLGLVAWLGLLLGALVSPNSGITPPLAKVLRMPWHDVLKPALWFAWGGVIWVADGWWKAVWWCWHWVLGRWRRRRADILPG